MDPLVSTDWLAARLSEVAVLDASWHMDGRDAEAEFRARRVPGARRFDIDAVADLDNPLPHTAPSPGIFAAAVAALGIGPATPVVIYDALGLFSAPRAWWTFRLMGHRDVAVLDGGLPKWAREGRPVEGEDRGDLGPPVAEVYAPPRDGGPRGDAGQATVRGTVAPRNVLPHLGQDQSPLASLATADDVAHALASGAAQVVDARSRARFQGEAAEPRAGVRAGHMPGAVSLPFGEVLNADGTMKDADGLRAALAAEGIDPARPVIATCGSGITAAVLALALARLGRTAAVYDGSWAEWGADPARPVAVGG